MLLKINEKTNKQTKNPVKKTKFGFTVVSTQVFTAVAMSNDEEKQLS